MNRTLALICLYALTHSAVSTAHAMPSGGIVHSVVRAPIVPDGDVAGARTDFVFNFMIDMDPAVEGLSMAPGDQLRIAFPEGFVLNETADYPIANVGALPTCVPGNLQCTTGVLLQGWPQNPLSPATYDIDIVDNVMSYTATANIGPNMFGPGMKQAHVILNGMRNPDRPGLYRIPVELERGGNVERGMGFVLIRPNIRPSINVTSVFDVPMDDPNGGAPPNPNFIYQQTGPGMAAPLIWNFLLWDTKGDAFTGVYIEQHNRHGGRLLKGRRTVGTWRIFAPRGATGQSLVALAPSFASGTPVIGMTFGAPIMTGRLQAVFTAGSALGRYHIVLRMNNGNEAVMVVDVVD